MAFLILRRVAPLRAVYVGLGGFMLLSPTVHPWYLVWMVPFLCFFPSAPRLLLTATVVLAYHAPALGPAGAAWREDPLFKALEYAPFFAMAALGRTLRLSRGPTKRPKMAEDA